MEKVGLVGKAEIWRAGRQWGQRACIANVGLQTSVPRIWGWRQEDVVPLHCKIPRFTQLKPWNLSYLLTLPPALDPSLGSRPWDSQRQGHKEHCWPHGASGRCGAEGDRAVLVRRAGGKEGRERVGPHWGARRVIHLSQASYHSHNVGSPR